MFLDIGLVYQFSILAWLDNNWTIFLTWENLKNTVFGLFTHDFGGVIEVKKID